MIGKITSFGVNNAYTSNLNVQNTNNVSFAGKGSQKLLKEVLDKSFERIYTSRFNHNLGQYAGTTKNGTKIFLDETRFGKEATLHIQQTNAANAIQQYTLLRDSELNKILNENNEEISNKKIQEIGRFISTLK